MPQLQKFFTIVLNQSHSSPSSEGSTMVKCLENLGLDLAKTIIIENHVENYSQNLTNGIFLPTFYLNSEDHWLKLLSEYLLEFESVQDVRDKIRRDF